MKCQKGIKGIEMKKNCVYLHSLIYLEILLNLFQISGSVIISQLLTPIITLHAPAYLLAYWSNKWCRVS